MSLLNLAAIQEALVHVELVPQTGRVKRASGLIVEATLPQVPVGTTCDIARGDGRRVKAQVVGFDDQTALLMLHDGMQGISAGAEVRPVSVSEKIPVGDALLGRVVNADMQPIDGLSALRLTDETALEGTVPNAMSRRRIARPLNLGIRAIDAFLTCGEGQRIGIMAGPGVGKSVLLGMLARNADADVIVLGLIGERGREVREFVERDLGPEGLARSVVVVATGDEAPLMRVRAASVATAVAEHFRAQGKRVLLLMDSLTRMAMAQREIGLSVGEPPTSKGYPPSVFAQLPRLLERAGNDGGTGSITALYTVLAEGDDMSDPVADAARAALDGHIILSRALANAGHFPAIDILQSVSRVMNDIVDDTHKKLSRSGREVLATYRDASDLIEVGAYVKGSNPRIDRAIATIDAVNGFCRQDAAQVLDVTQTLTQLEAALTPEVAHA